MKRILFLIIIFSIAALQAAVINVPTDYATIKTAYAAAAAGDTINVAAGFYADTYIDFDKAITLRGANAGVSGISARGPESLWASGGSTIRLKCDNVIIDGFHIHPSSNRWLDTNHNANGFQFINNLITCNNANSNVFQTEGAVSYRDWVISNNLFSIGDKTMLYLGGGGSAADFTNLLISGNYIEGNEGNFIFWSAGVPANFRFHNNYCSGICVMNAGKVGNLSVKGNTFKNSYYCAFQCGIENGEVVDNTFDGGIGWAPYGANLFELWGGEWGTPVSHNVHVANNIFRYNNDPNSPVHGPRIRTGGDASSIIFENNTWQDMGARNDAFAIRNQGANTLYVGINDWSAPEGYAVHSFQGDIVFPGAWLFNGKTLYVPHITVVVWLDANQNGVVDADEKGLSGVEVRMPKGDKLSKHLTNAKGKCAFKDLDYSDYELTVVTDNFPSGFVCTTGATVIPVSLTDNNAFPIIYVGFTGDGLESLSGDDVIEPRPQAETAAPNDLVFVTGTPTGDNGKAIMDWNNAIDHQVEGNDATTWAMADATTGDDVPWAVFEFADQGSYKFDYIKFQTDNGTDDDAAKDAYQATKIEVLVSETSMDDFESVGVFNLKYGTTKLQWCKLSGEVSARYVKLRLLAPVVTGKYTQIVEFGLDTGSKTGPKPAGKSEELAILPQTSELLSNYPNPFNPITTIQYAIAQAAQVKLTVFDLTGKQVAELVNSYQSAGSYNISFDASALPSGMYFYTIHAGSFHKTNRMMLIK